MLIKKKLIIFDLDGVLINSLPNMVYSWNAVKKKFNLKSTFKDYRKFIGLPFYEILSKLKINKLKKEIFNTYNKNSTMRFNKIKVYKGTNEVLKKIKKKNYIAIFTSKNEKRTKLILRKIKINFDMVITPEYLLKGKPHPEGINIIKKNFKTLNKNTFYVGDTEFDRLAAEKAGINFFFADWGYGSIIKNKKIIKIKKIKEIFKHI